MCSKLKSYSFKDWCKRVSGKKLKHGFTDYKTRFKPANQKWKSNRQKNLSKVPKEVPMDKKKGIKIG